jgi:hypothetical protein
MSNYFKIIALKVQILGLYEEEQIKYRSSVSELPGVFEVEEEVLDVHCVCVPLE